MAEDSDPNTVVLPPFDPQSMVVSDDEEARAKNYKVLSHGKTYYEVHGDSGPWIMLMHGIIPWSFIWQHLAASLKNQFRVLIFGSSYLSEYQPPSDFYGRGKSDAPLVEYTVDLLAQQAEELLKALEIDKLSVLGFSMGGAIATRFAVRNPEKIEKLILVDPSIAPVPVPFIAKLMTTRGIGTFLWNRFGQHSLVQRWRKDRFKDDFAHPEKFPELIEQTIQRCEWVVMQKKGFMESLHSTLRYFPFERGMLDDVEKLNKGEYPILLIWGEEDVTCPYKGHELVMQKIPKAKFVSVKDTGHNVPFEQPALFQEELVKFLTQETTEQ